MGFVGRVKDSVLALFGYPTKQRPEQAMDSMIAQMSVNLRKCKGQVAIVLASQKRLQEQYNQNVNMVTQYQVKALAAVGRSEEELARELLRKKKRYQDTVDELKVQLDKHKNTSENLMETVRKLELKLEETKRNKLLLLTQKQCYETSRLIEDGMEGENGEGGFQDMLDGIEDEVNALRYSSRIGMDVETEQLEGEEPKLELPPSEKPKVSVEDELLNLKQRLTSGADPATLEAGAPGVLQLVSDDEDEEDDEDDEDGGIEILSSTDRAGPRRAGSAEPEAEPGRPDEPPGAAATARSRPTSEEAPESAPARERPPAPAAERAVLAGPEGDEEADAADHDEMGSVEAEAEADQDAEPVRRPARPRATRARVAEPRARRVEADPAPDLDEDDEAELPARPAPRRPAAAPARRRPAASGPRRDPDGDDDEGPEGDDDGIVFLS